MLKVEFEGVGEVDEAKGRGVEVRSREEFGELARRLGGPQGEQEFWQGVNERCIQC